MNYGYYNYYTDPLMNYTNFFAVTAVAVLLAVVGVWSWLYCLLPGYFLCYRIGTWFLMRHSRGVQERIRRNRQQHGTLGE